MHRVPYTSHAGPPARALGAFLPKVTKKVFEKYGFARAAILTDWSTIVGAEMAAFTRPEKLSWPRKREEIGPDGERSGDYSGTLLLRVDGPMAIELQHRSDQILERINAYFGYRAVGSLRLIQAPLPRAKTRAPMSVSRPGNTIAPRTAIPTARTHISAGRPASSDAALPSALDAALASLSRRVEANR